MEKYTIEIISAEVSKKMGVFTDVITHLIYQYILDIDGIKESLCFRTELNPPIKKGFIKIDNLNKEILSTWIEADEIEKHKIQLKEYHNQKQAIETYIHIPKI